MKHLLYTGRTCEAMLCTMGVIEYRKLESKKEGCPLKNQEMRLQDANCSPPRIRSDSKILTHSAASI